MRFEGSPNESQKFHRKGLPARVRPRQTQLTQDSYFLLAPRRQQIFPPRLRIRQINKLRRRPLLQPRVPNHLLRRRQLRQPRSTLHGGRFSQYLPPRSYTGTPCSQLEDHFPGEKTLKRHAGQLDLHGRYHGERQLRQEFGER